MLRFANVATPPAAACVSVPASVPPAGLVPIATVTGPVKLGTAFPNASRALTTTAGVIAAPAPVVLGCPVNASALAAPATTGPRPLPTSPRPHGDPGTRPGVAGGGPAEGQAGRPAACLRAMGFISIL